MKVVRGRVLGPFLEVIDGPGQSERLTRVLLEYLQVAQCQPPDEITLAAVIGAAWRFQMPMAPESLTWSARSLVTAIHDVLSNRATAEDALQRCGNPGQFVHRSLAAAWHTLAHYAADADIHVRDPDYEQQQREDLVNCSRNLRSEFGL